VSFSYPNRACFSLHVACVFIVLKNKSKEDFMADKENDKKTAAAARVANAEFLQERNNFRSLILKNPNYFGNIKNSPFKAVLSIKSNTTYEEIGCVGYQPQFKRLEAVVFTKKPYGYGGGICSQGSQEYVRFYLSYDHGATWEDQGLSAFTARDIPAEATDGKRLEYAVTKQIDPKRKFCFRDNVIHARAILSWNVAPPANSPNFVPIWGETHTTHIQVEPFKLIILGDLLKAIGVKATTALSQAVDLEQPVPAAKKALSVHELHHLYRDKGVEPHRYALAEVAKLAQEPAASVDFVMADKFPGLAKAGPLAGLDLNIDDILGSILNPGDGNTSYEELACVGLNTKQDTLVGVIRVKKGSGYSGGPCTKGSHEYVAFWADVNNNGIFETYLGTAAVNVHDVDVHDGADLEYSVFLPVDLEKYRRPCTQGPRVIPIRAILSWNVAPPPGNPNYVPVWGNREETRVLVEPGKIVQGATPILSSVGDMAVSIIASNGKATGTGNLTGFNASDSPFGGRINIAGKVAYGTASSKYRVMKKKHGAPDSDYKPIINDPLVLTLVTFSGGVLTIDNDFHVAPDANGYYAYQDYSSTHFVDGNLLVRWYSTEAEHGNRYDLRVDLDTDGNPAHDVHSEVVTALIDNKAPDVSLTIDLGVDGECADFDKGTVFTGTFSATDQHFMSYGFEVRPSGPANGAAPVPTPASQTSIHYGGAIADPGVSAGTYTMDTSPMKPCGYSLTIRGWSRTNVNSGTSRHSKEASVGFCVRVPEEA
jgi:hypothetical protein